MRSNERRVIRKKKGAGNESRPPLVIRNIILKTKHWWQRNFGHVYLKNMDVLGDGRQYLFRTRHGKIALVWHIIDGTDIQFVCRLAINGEVQNFHSEYMSGYGKQYGGWMWSYEPFSSGEIYKGGYW